MTTDEIKFDEFDRQFYDCCSSHTELRNRHVRLAFINRALDENLARAIHQTISSTRTSGALPLRKLKLSVTDRGVFSTLVIPSIQDVLEEISRSWLVVRDPRDDHPDELLVQELGGQEGDGTHRMPLARDVEVVFRKIWPKSRKEGGDWRDDWHSWPLWHI